MARSERLPRRTVRTLAGALLALALLSGWNAANAGIPGKDRLPGVRVSKDHEQARKGLESDLPACGGSLVLFSGRDALAPLMLPLHRSRLLKELTVVLPVERELTAADVPAFRDSLEGNGTFLPGRDSLEAREGGLVATIEGLPVRYLPVVRVPEGTLRGLLAIDSAFVVPLYRNEKSTPLVDLPLRVVRTLESRKVEAIRAHVWDSTGSEGVPLEAGFTARLFRELLEGGSDALAGAAGEKWATLKEADEDRFFSRVSDAVPRYRKFLEAVPDDASTSYKLAFLAFTDLDAESATRWMERAAAADPAFERGYRELADFAIKKKLPDDADSILRFASERHPGNSLLAGSLAALRLERGIAAREAGNEEAAKAFLSGAASVEGADESLRRRARSLLETPGTVPRRPD
jgi:hypothetical protein